MGRGREQEWRKEGRVRERGKRKWDEEVGKEGQEGGRKRQGRREKGEEGKRGSREEWGREGVVRRKGAGRGKRRGGGRRYRC